MDTLSGMRLFAKVVETGSFSAAGRQLGLNASSVSRQVGALEDALGTRLLNRSTRSLGLTEAGGLYYERARRIVADVDEVNAAVSELNETPRGTLRLNVPVVFGRRYVAPYMQEFLEAYPEVRVELNVTDHYVDLIEEGADLAIRIGGTSQQSYIVRKLASIDRVLCASTEYLERHGRQKLGHDVGQQVPASDVARRGADCQGALHVSLRFDPPDRGVYRVRQLRPACQTQAQEEHAEAVRRTDGKYEYEGE